MVEFVAMIPRELAVNPILTHVLLLAEEEVERVVYCVCVYV